MRMRKLDYQIIAMKLLMIGVVACLVTYASAGSIEGKQDGSSSTEVQPKAPLPKLFEFARFKSMFHKRYSTFLEEMRRMKIFLGRALDAFLSMVRYKRGETSSCRTITSMSDYTDEEVRNTYLRPEAMGLDAKWVQSRAFKDNSESKDRTPVASIGDVQEVLATIAQHKDDLKYAQAAAELEHSSTTGSKANLRRRRRDAANFGDLSIDDLIRPDDSVDPNLPPPKPVGDEESNNPFYVEPDVGKSDQVVEEIQQRWNPEWDEMITDVKDKDGVRKFLSEFESKPQLTDEDFPISDLPDEIFVDLRTNRCLTPARNQDGCGACYIFSTTALHEYWHCKLTGNTQEFSEQYAIDCGGRFNLNGCAGGDELDVNTLYNMCGLELREHYPFKGEEGTCPYDTSTWGGRRQMGWWRYSGVTDLQTVPYANWPEALEQGRPLLVNIFVHAFFPWHGAGVDKAIGCSPSVGGHSMLLVGHGREKGREYWLFKNSHGAAWGDYGYYKMDKRAAEECLIMMSGRELDIQPDSSGFLFAENTLKNGTLAYKIN